MTRVVDSEL